MNNRNKWSLIINVLLVVFGFVGLYLAMAEGNIFTFYTNDANILSLVASLVFVIYMLIKKDVGKLPYFVLLLRYFATTCLALTFVIIFYLASTYGGTYLQGLLFYLTNKSFLFFHLLCPILAVISFTLFEGDRRLNKKKTITLALLPTVLYAVILTILNMTSKVVGPYPFLMVNRNSPLISIIWAVAILVITYVLARFILLYNQKHSPRRKRKEA